MVRKTNNLWSSKEVADHYGVSLMTIKNWIEDSVDPIPVYVVGKKTRKYDMALVKEWMDRRNKRLGNAVRMK